MLDEDYGSSFSSSASSRDRDSNSGYDSTNGGLAEYEGSLNDRAGRDWHDVLDNHGSDRDYFTGDKYQPKYSPKSSYAKPLNNIGSDYNSFGSGFGRVSRISNEIRSTRQSLSSPSTYLGDKKKTLVGEDKNTLLVSVHNNGKPNYTIDSTTGGYEEYEGMINDRLGLSHNDVLSGKIGREQQSYKDNFGANLEKNGNKVGDYSFDEYNRAYSKGVIERGKDIITKNISNSVIDFVTTPINNAVSKAAFNVVGGGSKGIVAGIGSSIATGAGINTMANKLNNYLKEVPDSYNQLQKIAFNNGYYDQDKHLKNDKSWLQKGAEFLGGGISTIATGPIGGAITNLGIGTVIDSYNHEKYLKENRNNPIYREEYQRIQEDRNKREQEKALSDLYRSDHSSERGILSTILDESNKKLNYSNSQLSQYSIPALGNLWSNIIFK